MKKISVCFFTLFLCISVSSQNKEKIAVKKQEQLFFYRLSSDSTATIVKNISDKFLIQMTNDFKGIMVFSIENGSFVKTEAENIYRLIHMPGLKYRGYFPADDKHSMSEKPPNDAVNYKTELKIEIDGASSGNKEEITIEVQNIKTEKVLLSNRFKYSTK